MRLMRPLWLTIVSLGLMVSGCHLIFPFDVGERSDGGNGGDTWPADQGPADQAALDLTQDADRGAHDLNTSDLNTSDLIPCLEQAKIKGPGAACGAQCVSTTNDSDCDGLLDNVDTFSGCNTLLAKEEFAANKPPSGLVVTKGSVSYTCGEALLGKNAAITLAPDFLSKLQTKHVVETRLTVTKKLSTTDWSLTIVAWYSADLSFRCSYHQVGGAAAELQALRVDNKKVCGSAGDKSYQVSPALKPNETYALHHYYSGTSYFCRMLHPGGALQPLSGFACPLGPPKKLLFESTNLELSLDHVRAFTVP
jgi:hypothetical protein